MTSDAFLAFFSDKWKLAFTKIQQKPTFPNIHGSFVHSGHKRGPPGVPGGGRWADRGPCRCRAPLGVGEGHVAEHTPTLTPGKKLVSEASRCAAPSVRGGSAAAQRGSGRGPHGGGEGSAGDPTTGRSVPDGGGSMTLT